MGVFANGHLDSCCACPAMTWFCVWENVMNRHDCIIWDDLASWLSEELDAREDGFNANGRCKRVDWYQAMAHVFA